MKMEINFKLTTTMLMIAAVTVLVSAQPPLADESIGKDKVVRESLIRTGRKVATKPKWGFFGTVFNLIVEQINDTKSAYNRISDLVNGQFIDDNAVTVNPDTSNNGTTQSPKITKSEFLKIIDRNLKGLARLRNLEWRESKKDSRSNLQGYWDEIFAGKNSKNSG